MRGALTFSFGLCAQVPVKDAVDPLECGLSAEWLMRHRVNDVLVVGPVPGFNEISIVLCLQRGVNVKRIRRLEGKDGHGGTVACTERGITPRVPCRHPALGRVALPVEVARVEARSRFEKLSAPILRLVGLHELQRVRVAAMY